MKPLSSSPLKQNLKKSEVYRIHLNKVTGSKLLTGRRLGLAFGHEAGADQGAGGADGCVSLHFADGGRGEVVE
jgi:hypothetical protein